MPVAAPNVVTEDRSEGVLNRRRKFENFHAQSGVFEKKKRSNDGICKAVFKASTLERELRRLKSKVCSRGVEEENDPIRGTAL
ncbi:hypothetical protein Pmar_PMAR022758 [Perkinsus marinus ATCC 50983]|uniref:Uncharacterized protein n=1 Tax=Perkinsus marinus (strain ATCC 50983 / TXsc) TaxID=423536 RepID=C5LTI1_PERM5|nr:hypothetical protein Pmar_PMAR022758 [Perkinsus marinus ATCC 50983]EEQ99972.1 hypothetical protein Pmar_PMAR022758 [Perkinsus marinus ATCC 50983]|eukprot:XP_002767255.1 hypothetical protein Pmar_PMAR022758 [Perkinsus marinus ATCC 50983]